MHDHVRCAVLDITIQVCVWWWGWGGVGGRAVKEILAIRLRNWPTATGARLYVLALDPGLPLTCEHFTFLISETRGKPGFEASYVHVRTCVCIMLYTCSTCVCFSAHTTTLLIHVCIPHTTTLLIHVCIPQATTLLIHVCIPHFVNMYPTYHFVNTCMYPTRYHFVNMYPTCYTTLFIPIPHTIKLKVPPPHSPTLYM